MYTIILRKVYDPSTESIRSAKENDPWKLNDQFAKNRRSLISIMIHYTESIRSKRLIH